MPNFTMKVTRQPGPGGGLAAISGKGRGGLRNALTLAAGLVHRHLIGLGRDHPPTYQQGVLPVWSGRLKNSFFTPPVTGEGNNLVSSVVSNLEYGPVSNARHGFMQQTVSDTRQPVNSLIASEMGNSLHG